MLVTKITASDGLDNYIKIMGINHINTYIEHLSRYTGLWCLIVTNILVMNSHL